jgi:hypothetical protein
LDERQRLVPLNCIFLFHRHFQVVNPQPHGFKTEFGVYRLRTQTERQPIETDGLATSPLGGVDGRVYAYLPPLQDIVLARINSLQYYPRSLVASVLYDPVLPRSLRLSV